MKRKKRLKSIALMFLLSILMLPQLASAIVPGSDFTPTNPSAASGSASGGWNLSSIANYGLPKATVSQIIENVLYWLLWLLGVAGVLGFVISGLLYLLSAGSPGMIERAKKGMIWSIVGIIVGLGGVVVIQFVNYALNGSPQ